MTRASTRVLVAFVCGLVAAVVASALMPWQAAMLVGWNTATVATVVWVLVITLPRDNEQTAAIALHEDTSRAIADLLLVASAIVSLGAVGAALIKAAASHGPAKAATLSLGILTVVSSWTLVHVVYMLRYSRLYYGSGGGIAFPDEEAGPDYRDFAYVAFTIGMTYQVSDTDLTTKAMRRNATHHALLSYVFGAVVIAVAINGVASLIK